MKLTLQREQLLKPLQLVIGAIDHKQAMPILSNVLLHVNNNTLSLTGTDLEIELIGQSQLSNTETTAGRLALPARKLMDICKALPESSAIELYQDNDRVVLKSARSRFTMSIMSADDFPVVESSDANIIFTISQEELSLILHRTAFAMAQQDVRYYLNGMLLEITGQRLRVVATDGHRLAMNQTIIKTDAENANLQVIVPYKAVMELMRLLKDADKNVTVHVGHHHIRVTSDDFVFTSKLVEGRFPDYQRVIPKMGDKQLLIDRDMLKQALLRTAILCHDKRGVRFELSPGVLKLSANNPSHDAAEEEIDIQYSGDQLDIGFNITYLLDVLNVMKPGSVRLTLIDTNSSMRIDEPGNEDYGTFVVMPMRL
jgi:DNA polymerase-3 subunit beta